MTICKAVRKPAVPMANTKRNFRRGMGERLNGLGLTGGWLQLGILPRGSAGQQQAQSTTLEPQFNPASQASALGAAKPANEA
eukprot:CAMPEP_0171074952 /NCGR_PEP_ID=MMETSP0766_2-20121228/12479_1 /TAXON_ID=439317 /ORGANISM="Gambierdiscus australes, Strain CAWD 149" /LENGTH=81 /DNA_ID=CAMNT_0011531781 /DNA_START=96 /DNA_END=342 /DNA_ORIENTATION=+